MTFIASLGTTGCKHHKKKLFLALAAGRSPAKLAFCSSPRSFIIWFVPVTYSQYHTKWSGAICPDTDALNCYICKEGVISENSSNNRKLKVGSKRGRFAFYLHKWTPICPQKNNSEWKVSYASICTEGKLDCCRTSSPQRHPHYLNSQEGHKEARRIGRLSKALRSPAITQGYITYLARSSFLQQLPVHP